MKDNKKAQEVAILVGLFVVLVIVGFISFSGMPSNKPIPGSEVQPLTSAHAAASNLAAAAPVAPTNGTLDWINATRVGSIVAEMQLARSPFEDNQPVIVPLPPGPNPISSGSTSTTTRPLPGSTGLPTTILPTPVVPSLPAPPAFVLCGVMIWDHQPAATILLDNKYQTVHAGDMLGETGWTVHAISPDYCAVSLSKHGYQSIWLRQTGGSQK